MPIFILGGRVFWDTLDFDSMTIFILGGTLEHLGFGLYDNFHLGGILGHLGFGLYDNFHLGGILGHLGFELYDNFHFGGLFWDTSDLDSLTIFIWGYSGTPQIWTLCQFSFRGSILGHLRFGFYDNFHFGGGSILGHLGF